MEWVETTGRTLEEAKDSALDRLGVDEHDVEFDIVEEPKLGLFGRIRTEARVRARIRPASPRAKEDGRDRRRRSRSVAPSPEVVEGAEVRSAPPVVGPARAPAPAAASIDRGRESPTMERSHQDVEVSLAGQAEVARLFLAGLLDSFAVVGEIEVRQRPTAAYEEEVADLFVTGADLGLLIGPQGGTLNAIQEITRTVVQRQTGARNGRLLVDVGGYRAKRSEALERFARQVADQVYASGQRVALEPMHAADRKVVHDTVNTIDGVSTVSEGEEPRRRVVVEPAVS